jgi:hypothetical protein
MFSKDFQTFGWQGILLSIPKDWNLSYFTGNFEKGYLRINDLVSVRCEIKWEKTLHSSSLSLILNNYYKKMKKIADRKKLNFEIKGSLENVKIKNKNIEYLTFSWESREICWGVVWYCYICKRIFIIQLLSTGKNTPYREILSSLDCEADKYYNIWSVYNLYLKVPKRYFLKESNFRAGLIHLKFSDKKQNISIFWYGLANVVLEEKSLSSWFVENFLDIFTIYKTEEKEIFINGHKGIEIEGVRDSYLRDIFSKFLLNKVDEKFLKIFLWVCENSNRICILKTSGREIKEIEEIREGWKCH